LTAEQGILDKLQCELTQELVDRLVAYCAMKASRRPWYGMLVAEDPSMAQGQKPEDIVQTAIEDHRRSDPRARQGTAYLGW